MSELPPHERIRIEKMLLLDKIKPIADEAMRAGEVIPIDDETVGDLTAIGNRLLKALDDRNKEKQ